MQNTEKNPPVQTTLLSLQSKLDFFIELILIFVLVISPLLFGSVAPFPVVLIEISAFLILFLWLVKCISNGFCEFIKLSINKPILLFLLFVLIQYLFINFFVPEFSLGAVYRQKIKNEGLKLFSYLMFFYVVLNNFHGRKKINRLIYVLIFVGFCISFLGIIQKLSGAEKIFWIDQAQSSRAGVTFFSSFPNRSHFANYTNMIIFLALGGVFSQFPLLRDYIKGLDKESVIKGLLATFQKGIWLYVFGLIIMSTGLFYSLSRGGMLSFLFGLVFFSVLIAIKGLTKRGYLFLLAILIFTLGALVWINAPEQIAQRFSVSNDADNPLIEKMLGERKIFVEAAFGLIKKYPVYGVGFGTFEFIYNDKYAPILFAGDGKTRIYINHLHNDFVELFCEVGLVGFIIFFIGASLYIFFMIKTLWKRHDPYVVGVGTGALAGLLSMCVHSLLDFNFHITSNAVLFFVIAALAIVVANLHIRNEKEITSLPKGKPFLIKNLYLKILIVFILSAVFFHIAKIIIKPYIAYRISSKEKLNIVDLKEAIKLDPLNDKYHFLLAKFFIEKARRDIEHDREYMDLASREVKEAIRLNPRDTYYPVYLEWISKVFKPSIEELINS